MDTAGAAVREGCLSRALLLLKRSHPFFATLSLFADYHWREDIPTAATDGRRILLNPDWYCALPPAQRGGILLHEILHAALEHIPRRGGRDRLRWNIAADIVVNGMIDTLPGLALPEGAVRWPEMADESVEFIYERISYREPPLILVLGEGWRDLDGPGEAETGLHPADALALSGYWRAARHRAQLAEKLAGKRPGSAPFRLPRDWQAVQSPQLDWRTLLWRFLTRTPVDYNGFDRRFLHQGLYLDMLESERLNIALCVDTSGSIEDDTLDAFVPEILAIQRAYPHLNVTLFFADAELYGPYPLQEGRELPKPVGGGGTSFIPFFNQVAALNDDPVDLCVYLTDGYGDFPATPPEMPVLWVIVGGGIESGRIPFGDTARLADA